MRIPSRRMPPAPERPTLGLVGTTMLLVLFSIGLLALAWAFWPMSAAVIGGLGLLSWALNKIEGDRVRQLAAERTGESICTFARSLDFRSIDTWIIRAVYEEVRAGCPLFPIRAADRLDDEIGIDDEDLDDLLGVMAYRSGRSLAETATNPLIDRLATVHDLVLFLSHQPRVERA